MRARGGLALVALILVGLPLGVFLVARTTSAGAASQREHYFMVGERHCSRALQKLSSSDGASATRLAINLSGYPAAYRGAVQAGCNAAVRQLPLLGSGSPSPAGRPRRPHG